MHFCADELLAIMSALPFVGFGVAWLHRQIRKILHRGCEHSDNGEQK